MQWRHLWTIQNCARFKLSVQVNGAHTRREWRQQAKDVLTKGDSSVLHCTSLLRTIFASLARANELVYVHNERNFPQAKLDNEMYVLFLLNTHGDLFFSIA